MRKRNGSAVLADLAASPVRCDPALRLEFLTPLTTDPSATIDLAGWHRSDHIERKAGEIYGKPREKITSISDMLAAAAIA
ncbi:MAG: hypothetical protein ABJL72_09885 [Roseobacter sp.]